MLSAKNISKFVSNREILRDVDIDVPPGQVTVLLGPNGAGKSTLLRCLALVDIPDLGELRIDDQTYRFPAAAGTFVSPWPRLTALFQGLHLWPHMTIRQNILGPLHWQQRQTDGRAIERILTDFDLKPVLARLPSECSGGERQRAAVARAMVLEPKYLLLDEPTASADVEHAHILSRYLREFATKGCAVLVVTHMFGFARTLADRVVFMESGAIAECGGPALLTAPTNATLQRFVSLH